MKPSADWLEYQQLKQTFPSKPADRRSKLTFWSRLENIWQSLIKRLVELPELRVWHTCDQEGNIWWNAYDPTTRQSLYQISEEQMRVWIERRYQ